MENSTILKFGVIRNTKIKNLPCGHELHLDDGLIDRIQKTIIYDSENLFKFLE